MKIALVNPQNPRLRDKETKAVPLSLGLIAAYLGTQGHEAHLYDLEDIDAPVAELVRRHRLNTYPVVGLTTYTPSFRHAMSLAEEIKRTGPDVFLVLGGHHVTPVGPENSIVASSR
jgi:hypothetical protein